MEHKNVYKRRDGWVVHIYVMGTTIYIGTYTDYNTAVKVADAAERIRENINVIQDIKKMQETTLNTLVSCISKEEEHKKEQEAVNKTKRFLKSVKMSTDLDRKREVAKMIEDIKDPLLASVLKEFCIRNKNTVNLMWKFNLGERQIVRLRRRGYLAFYAIHGEVVDNAGY